MTRINLPIASIFGFVTCLPLSATAFEVELSGQVNRALMSVDNAAESEIFHVDNDNSGSRIRVKGNHEISQQVTAGIEIELEYQDNASNTVNFAERNIDGEFNERKIEAFYIGPWGKISIGQGDGAANGNIERDLSGTAVAAFSNPALMGGGIAFREPGFVPGTEDEGTDPLTISDTISNLDFESRYDRVRYDLPSFASGVAISTSIGSKSGNDVVEVGTRLKPSLGSSGGKLEIAVGYSSESRDGAAGDEQTVGGSVTWLSASGINFTIARSESSDDNPTNPDSDFQSLKLGYKHNTHAFALHYGLANDRAQLGDESTVVGAAYTFTPFKKTEIYGAFKTHSLDRPGSEFSDIDIVSIGTRIKF